jgi:hypothetical protein
MRESVNIVNFASGANAVRHGDAGRRPGERRGAGARGPRSGVTAV